MAIARSCSKPSGATSRRCELVARIAPGRSLSSYQRSNPPFQGSAWQRGASHNPESRVKGEHER